jgi:hypothetical protein
VSGSPWYRRKVAQPPAPGAQSPGPDVPDVVANFQPAPVLGGTDYADAVTGHAEYYFMLEDVLRPSQHFPGEMFASMAFRVTFVARHERVLVAFDDFEAREELSAGPARKQLLWVAALVDEAGHELARQPHALSFERQQFMAGWSAVRELLLSAMPVLEDIWRAERLNEDARRAGSDKFFDTSPAYGVLGDLLDKATAAARLVASTVENVLGRESEVAAVRDAALAATAKAELEFLVTDPLLVDTASAQVALRQFQPKKPGGEGNVFGVV